MPERPRSAEIDWYTDSVHSGVYDNPGYESDDPEPAREPEYSAAPDFETYSTGEASLRGGEIVVTATDSGLPTMVRVTPDQLRRDPGDLAAEVLRLCRLAADRAGLRRREYLTGLGIGEDVLRLLDLPTPQAIEQSELADEAQHEYEPRSWLEQDGSTR